MAKILVIEDDQDIREQIVTILQYEGFTTMSADHGRIGAKLAQKYRPDLVICDILMPEMNGYQVLLDVRSRPRTETIPFIFLTGQTSKDDIRKGMQLGADDYLTKPFEAEDLILAVQTRLERHALNQKQVDTLRQNLSRALPHELCTPLTAILGFSDYMLKFGGTLAERPEEIEEIGKALYESVVRLRRLVENYLFYTELVLLDHEPEKQARWRLMVEPLRTKAILPMVAREALERYQRGDDLHLNLTEATVEMADEHFVKIVDELIDNVCKFSEPGSPIQIVTTVDGPHWILNITDLGRGMTDEQIAQIGAYMQFDRAKYEQQGSGLGLTIARKLVEWYQGELTVESIPQSTTVTVKLNCA